MKSLSAIPLLLILAFSSCTSETNNKKKNHTDSKDKAATTFKSLNTDSIIILLNKVKKFAEDFNPVSSSSASLSNIPDSIVYSFKQLRINGNNEYIKYLTLIFVKVYRTHLKCCHQGYELRKGSYYIGIDSISDPLLYEFNLISKTHDGTKAIEFIHSGIGLAWLEENKHLLEYDNLKREYQEIEKISAGILKDPNKYY